MANQTDLLNDALAQIGASRIDAIDDGSINANHCQTLYPELRRSLLRAHYWNFAATRVELALDAIPPIFEYTYSYTLPADFLRIVQYNGNQIGTPTSTAMAWSWGYWRWNQWYRIESDHLLSNDAQAFIVYIKDEINPDIWDSLFYQTVSTWLASKLASAITKDTKKASELLAMANNLLLPMSQAVDGQDNPTSPFLVDNLYWGR